jgi:hypothetical protein
MDMITQKMDTNDVKVVTNMDFAMMKERWMRDREH